MIAMGEFLNHMRSGCANFSSHPQLWVCKKQERQPDGIKTHRRKRPLCCRLYLKLAHRLHTSDNVQNVLLTERESGAVRLDTTQGEQHR